MSSFLPVLLFGISGGEVFIILLFILLFFGPKKIPEIARFLGKGMNEVKKIQREFNDEMNKSSVDNSDSNEDIKKDIERYKNHLKETDTSEDNINDDGNFSNGNDDIDSNDDLPYPYNQAGKDDK
ncbi:MAG: twin-arginine translocase TatA/TatE family subunit [Bacteroidales bacterium]